MGNRFVLQYKLYCEHGVGLCRDTAQAGVGHAQLGAGAQRWGARGAGARRRQARRRGPTRGAQQTSGRGAASAQGRAAGRAAGPTGCALGALCLFLARFDSVLFLSQIFRHCS